jgi:uncharacterized membrane protein
VQEELTMHRNVGTWERAASIGLGTMLVASAFRRRVPAGRGAALGLSLIARGAAGYCPVNAVLGRSLSNGDTRAALGGSRGIKLKERITIARRPEEVYGFWRNLSRLPLFMRHLDTVEPIDDRRSHWVMRGPGGVRLEWDAEVINEIPRELIAWKSLAGADIVSAGSVRFEPVGQGTEVTVTMQYQPPIGKTGATLAWLAGQSPASHLHDDLQRMKQLLETSRADAAEDAEDEDLDAAWRREQFDPSR